MSIYRHCTEQAVAQIELNKCLLHSCKSSDISFHEVANAASTEGHPAQVCVTGISVIVRFSVAGLETNNTAEQHLDQ